MSRSTRTKDVRARIYARRQRDGPPRFYGDFRHLRGKREALKERGSTTATTDAVTANRLYWERVAELERGESRPESRERPRAREPLSKAMDRHLRIKAKAGKVTERWVEQTRGQLEVAARFFGPDRDLLTLRADPDIRQYVEYLETKGGRGGVPLGPGSVRHYLNSLSNLFQRIQERHPRAPNPVAQLQDKPSGRSRQAADFLEVPEAGRLLRVAREYDSEGEGPSFMFPLLATYLLTGGRATEVLGLEVEDVKFHSSTVHIRPNQWRRLKTKTANRRVPLWPQLAGILRAYVDEHRPRTLLFPSPYWEGRERMISDFRKALDSIGARAGWERGRIRSKMFRHTYATARLQTVESGVPVALWTVARELGHSSPAMIERVYGHPSDFRHRSEVVEYPIDEKEVGS